LTTTHPAQATGGEFAALHNIAVDHQGNIFTAEVNTGQRVQKFRRLDQQE
jgi:hypothetical protein